MSLATPIVTVYIPTYNRLGLLKRAIESVLGQSYRSVELIVVDDCSTDGTAKYLTDLANRDRRVIFLQNQENSGACHSRNRAIEKASGEFITGLDDDDYFLKNRVEDFVNYWTDKCENTVALCSSYVYELPNGSSDRSSGNGRLQLADMYLRNLVGSQIFTTTRKLKEMGGFDTNFSAWQDYDLWISLLTTGDIETVDNHSYVVDRSHDFQRISSSSYQKIQNSCSYFLSKHQITGKASIRVRSQLLIYRWTITDAIRFLLLFTAHADIQGIKAVVMRTYRFIKKTPN